MLILLYIHIKIGKQENFPRFFEQIEFYLVNGDDYIKEIIVAGLLEDIQNIASHEKLGYKVFEKLLGPTSKGKWKALESDWENVQIA